ncbi:unnamed protein product, partial [Brassica oleracea]
KNHDRLKSKGETESKKKGLTVSETDSTKLTRADRVITCSNCKQDGHNRTTCKNDFVESQPKKPRGRPMKNQVQSHASSSQPSQGQSHASSSQPTQPQVSTQPQGSTQP